jgi:hypothetical protein
MATTSALRARVAGSSQAAEIDIVIAAVLPSTTSPRAWPTARSLGGERPEEKPR